MQHKFATTNGIQLHYVEEGSGELVILLHGFPEYWYSWRNQIPVLSKTHRVVAVDMRGFNLSDKPQDIAAYSMDKLAKDIADLISALGEERAILIGHDWGAGVAWATAILYPERISKLGIINVPHPYEMQKALKGGNISQLLKSYYIFLFQIPRLPEYLLGKDLKNFFKKTFKSMSPHKTEVSDEVAGQYAEAYSQPGALTAALNYYRAMLRYRKALPYVPTPIFYDGRSYFVRDGGIISSLNAKTGEPPYALERLPAEQAQVLRLSYYEDEPHARIATELGLPLGTVKSRIRLAVAQLRKLLDA